MRNMELGRRVWSIGGLLLTLVMITITTMAIGLPYTTAQAAVSSGAGQVTKAKVAMLKAEQFTSGKSFDPKAATTLLNTAVQESVKVKKLGKAYASVYATLEKRSTVVRGKINLRNKVLAQAQAEIEAERTKAERQKAAADKAIAEKKAVADKLAAEKKAAADKLAVEKAAADKLAAAKLAAEKAAADKAVADKLAADKAATAKGIEIHGFYSGKTVYDNKTEGYLKGLTSVSFIWRKLLEQSGVGELSDKNTGDDFCTPQDYSKALRFCKSNNIATQLAIYGDGNAAKAVMQGDATRKDLIDKILSSMSIQLDNGETYEFGGVVIDFEGFRQEDTKLMFNKFLNELKPRLTEKGKRLYVAVNVLENYKGYDYKEILKQADKVILMAHDYSPKSDLTKADINRYMNYDSNNPIYTYAPINRVRQALEALTASVSQSNELSKIWLQISFGAVQWQFAMDKPDGWATLDASTVGTYYTTSSMKIQTRVENSDKLGINFNYGYINVQQSPYMTYYNTGNKTFNFILYDDSRSITAKMQLTKELGIGGISLWRLGIIPDFTVNGLSQQYFDVWNTMMKEKN